MARPLLTALLALLRSTNAASDFGLNLPTLTGTSGTGAFLPGVYNFSYPPQQLPAAKQRGFASFRLPVNVPTANSPATLAQMQALVSGIGGSAVICMFGTGNLTTHGTVTTQPLAPPATATRMCVAHALRHCACS